MVSIDAVDPADDSAPREWFAMEVAAHAVDRARHAAPSWAWHRAQLTAPWPGEEMRAWIARVDGHPVGTAFLALPREDNTDTASGEITVHPDHRRAGGRHPAAGGRHRRGACGRPFEDGVRGRRHAHGIVGGHRVRRRGRGEGGPGERAQTAGRGRRAGGRGRGALPRRPARGVHRDHDERRAGPRDPHLVHRGRPEHRRRRLGLQVQLANLEFARTLHRAIRQIDTYNAVANPHMIAINEAIGFRPLDRLLEYQLDL